jgi:hypothetical protein
MQQASTQMLQLLSSSVRIAAVEVIVQMANPLNTLQVGSQLVLDGILGIDIQHNEEQSTDTIRIALANTDGRYSPYQGSPIVV